ncbi:hypothetical protein TNCT_42541 [Trichonephila clavata]|uniref:Uncharacterized protein n=1 Tax=Trichonephila clavata TaxID=2740835 RepID=A0A8X6FXE8_TRICU|nr:hypothetical protein TNCT_42541 [Trichonephila clavata]
MACGGGRPVLGYAMTTPSIHGSDSTDVQAVDKDVELAFEGDAVARESKTPDLVSSVRAELAASQAKAVRLLRIRKLWRRRAYFYSYFRQRFPKRLLPYGVGQLILFSLLIPWPLSLGIMGFLFFTDCPMNEFMVFCLFLECAMGIIALGSRLTLIAHMIQSFPHPLVPDPLPMFMQKLVKCLEFLFLCFFTLQLTCYYWQGYSTNPLSSYYCNPTLYTFITVMNYFSLTMVMIWINMHFYNWYYGSHCC